MTHNRFRHPGNLLTAGFLFALLLFAGCAATVPQRKVSVEDVEIKKKALDLFVEGKAEEAKGNRDSAIALYFEALQFTPQSIDIVLALSKAFIGSGKAMSAIHFARRATELDPANVESWRILQYLYQETGDIARAAESLETALKMKPDSDIGAVYRLGQYYFSLGQRDKAKKILLDRVRKTDTPRDEMLGIAGFLSDNDLYAEAISVYTRLIERDPADVDSWAGLGRLYSELGQEKKADDTYRKALELNPGDITLLLSLGNNCMAQNNWDCAISFFEKARAAGFSKSEIRSTLTALYYYANRLKEAEALRDSVVSQGEDDALFYFFSGKALNFRERFADASEYFRKGFEKPLDKLADDKLLNAYVGYVQSLIRTNRGEDALLILQEDAVKRIKDTHLVKDIEGTVYLEMKRFDDAAGIYEWLMDADPENSRYPIALTQALNGAGKYPESEKLLRGILAKDPENTRYLMQLGIVYDYMKDLDKAEEVLLRIIRKEPGNALALNNLAYMYIDNNRNLSKAIEMARRALKIDPGNGAYLDTLAWGYFRKGDLKQAREFIENALTNSDRQDKGVIYDHYGDILSHLGMKDQARDAYQKAIEFGEGADKLQEKIDKLGR
ncbi:MAG: tetratricopeptide repeat protein [Candidatus Latescibacterota bacterium]